MHSNANDAGGPGGAGVPPRLPAPLYCVDSPLEHSFTLLEAALLQLTVLNPQRQQSFMNPPCCSA